VADLKQALDEGRVSFGAEEINKTLESVLAFSTGERLAASKPEYYI
jgi:hypothetical protein